MNMHGLKKRLFTLIYDEQHVIDCRIFLRLLYFPRNAYDFQILFFLYGGNKTMIKTSYTQQ